MFNPFPNHKHPRPMPTSFLDLPRELRDEIYAYLLRSPLGVVSPQLIPHSSKPSSPRSSPSTSSSSQPTARFALCTNPHSLQWPSNSDSYTQSKAEPHYISLSLPRTCRQIYAETRGLFWEQNTFYFSKQNAGAIKSLKLMGQVSSRLITSVTIQMDNSKTLISSLSKTLNVLASRARFGHFRKLELIWDCEEFARLQSMSMDIPMAKARRYDELLEGLRTGERGGRFERVIRLPHDPWGMGSKSRETEVCARDLHFAFGGRLFLGDVLAWENWKRVVTAKGIQMTRYVDTSMMVV